MAPLGSCGLRWVLEVAVVGRGSLPCLQLPAWYRPAQILSLQTWVVPEMSWPAPEAISAPEVPQTQGKQLAGVE